MSSPCLPMRRKKSSQERDEQRCRSEARNIQRLIKSFKCIQEHRGNQLTKMGQALLQALLSSAAAPVNSDAPKSKDSEGPNIESSSSPIVTSQSNDSEGPDLQKDSEGPIIESSTSPIVTSQSNDSDGLEHLRQAMTPSRFSLPDDVDPLVYLTARCDPAVSVICNAQVSPAPASSSMNCYDDHDDGAVDVASFCTLRKASASQDSEPKKKKGRKVKFAPLDMSPMMPIVACSWCPVQGTGRKVLPGGSMYDDEPHFQPCIECNPYRPNHYLCDDCWVSHVCRCPVHIGNA